MKTNIFSRIALATFITAGALSLGSCDDFLDNQKPQGTLRTLRSWQDASAPRHLQLHPRKQAGAFRPLRLERDFHQ